MDTAANKTSATIEIREVPGPTPSFTAHLRTAHGEFGLASGPYKRLRHFDTAEHALKAARRRWPGVSA